MINGSPSTPTSQCLAYEAISKGVIEELKDILRLKGSKISKQPF